MIAGKGTDSPQIFPKRQQANSSSEDGRSLGRDEGITLEEDALTGRTPRGKHARS